MIYLDTSALAKLVISEDETATLKTWLARTGVPRISSDIVRVELPRAVMRSQPTALLAGHRLIASLDTIGLTPQLLETAATLQPPALRSLDAIHLATAMAARRHITVFVAYDKRLLTAAEAGGFTVASPA